MRTKPYPGLFLELEIGGYKQMLEGGRGGGRGVNICEAQIYIKRHLKTKNITLSRGVLSLN